MPIRTGNIATGDDFFDRVNELEDLWRRLAGNHIVLAGPRRLGKSSLLKRLGEQAPKFGHGAQMVDVQGAQSAVEFIDAVDYAFPDATLETWRESLSKRLGETRSAIKKLDVKVAGTGIAVELQNPAAALWIDSARKLQARLAQVPLLILVDEFSVFLEKLIARDRLEAEALLSWLRTWRLTDTYCRFVFSGSVGISALLERHSFTNSMNDCHEFRLGPFRTAAALAMVTTLAEREGYSLSPDVVQYLCTRTGWLSPFYLSLLLDESITAARDRRQENPEMPQDSAIQISDIDDAYDRLLASRSRFVHWHVRLTRDLPVPERELALLTLRHLCRADQGLTIRQLNSRLSKAISDPQDRIDRLSGCLHYLEENGYVGRESEGNLHFLSFLLRDYWRRNHGV